MADNKGNEVQHSPPLYFWRETEQPHGWLSQWFACSFTHDGVTYSSTEQWMMVQKALLFKDDDIAKQIAATSIPREQQSLGRKVKEFDRRVWDENKSRIVEQGNYLKFTQSTLLPKPHRTSAENLTTLKSLLLATGDRELIEASPYDRIWGIGFSAANAPSHSRDMWGENLLGKAIMAVRDRLRDEGRR